jgi:hypothetical protein
MPEIEASGAEPTNESAEEVTTPEAEVAEEAPVVSDIPSTEGAEEVQEINSIDDLSLEQLENLTATDGENDPSLMDQILDGSESEEPEAEPEAEAVAETEEEAPEAEAEAEAEPETEEEDPSSVDDDGKRVNRLSLPKSMPAPTTRKLAAAKRAWLAGDHPTFEDALVEQLGLTAPQAKAVVEKSEADDQSEAPAPSNEEAPQEISDQKAKVTDLEAKWKKAKLADLDEEAEADLTLELIDAKADLKEMERNWKADQAAEADHVAAQNVSINHTVEEYPELNDDTSAFYQRFAEKKAFAQVNKPEVFNDPEWSATIADEVQKELGGAAKPKAKAEPSTVSKKPATPPNTRPVGAVAPGNAGQTRMSSEEALSVVDGIDDMDQLQDLATRLEKAEAAG